MNNNCKEKNIDFVKNKKGEFTLNIVKTDNINVRVGSNGD